VVKRRLYWTLQIGGWLLYAVVQIVASILATGIINPKRALFFLYEALIFLFVTHAFRIYVKQQKWIEWRMARLIPLVLLSVFPLGLVVYFLRLPVSFLLGLFDPRIAFDVARMAGFTSVYSVILFLWLVLYFTFHYFDQYNKALKYEASMVQIELNNLKSQLNPHFIFNALNSIRALVDENPKKSKQAINQLSTILRSSLASDKKGLTKFDEELKIVKDYLGLESIRFEERLKTEFDIHPESHGFFVPPLMIQTLVENGIKHGISKLTAGGIIQVRTVVEKGKLKISIRNSGHLINGVKKNSGIGLKNTFQRLKLIYGDEAAFRIVNENDNFVLTEVVIPQNKKV
jgi:two-component system LytT family sensor kinase